MKLIKRSTCPSCGAPKAFPAKHAYIYCDYCGSYMDYDLNHALQISGHVYDLKYSAFIEKNNKLKEKAIKEGNQDEHRKLVMEMYSMHMEKAPQFWSVRIGDVHYREDILHYIAHSETIQAFDEELRTINQIRLVKASNRLKTVTTNKGVMKYTSNSFWPYYSVYYELLTKSLQKLILNNLPPHPDQTDPKVMLRSTVSNFLKSYWSYLYDRDKEKILLHSGLIADYIEAKDIKSNNKTCGRCGGTILAIAESKQCLCEGCGYIIDLTSAEFPCPGCGLPLSLPVTKETLNCPSCSTFYKKEGAARITISYNGNTKEILDAMIDELKHMNSE